MDENYDLATEEGFMAKRYEISDKELAARVSSAPDMGGALLVELGEFIESGAYHEAV